MTGWAAVALHRMVIDVQEMPVKTFAPGRPPEHDMLQAWVSNPLPSDHKSVRFSSTWTLESSSGFNTQTQPGLWMGVLFSDMGNYTKGATEEVTLTSNGQPQHMGLLVKYRSDRVAYIVTPVGYQRVVNETGSWRLDEKALQPGRYRVEVRFRAIGGRRGSLSEVDPILWTGFRHS